MSLERILLIDDDEDVVSALEMIFKALGHEVQSFTEPKEAISEIINNPENYDVILCDLVMGEISGMDVLVKVREITKELYFILMSANASTQIISEAKKLSNTEFIEKPTVHLSFREAMNRLKN